jgi:MYXO-CTERM domain-containing protein
LVPLQHHQPEACDDSFGTRIGATSLGQGSSASTWSQDVSGLSPGTTYFFCAIAQNSVGTSFGAVLSFTSLSAPTVTTVAPQGINNTSALFKGTVNPGLDATTAWFRYSSSDPGSCDDTFGTRVPSTTIGAGSSAVPYAQLASALTPATTYYFCAIAQSSVGTSFGAVLSFTTTNGPDVTTAPATNVTASAATLNGSASPNLDTTTGWFRYSLTKPGVCDDVFGTRAPATGGSSLGAGSTPVAWSQAIGSLLPGATYYYCAVAASSHGTSFGSVASFTTPLLPVVTTSAATGVSDMGATLNGAANPNALDTTAWFRYDTSDPGTCNDSFGTRAPATSGTDLGSGNTNASYSEILSGLSAGTIYYYCAIASSAAGTSFGALMSFTAIAPSDGGVSDGGVSDGSSDLAGADLLNADATSLPELTSLPDLRSLPDLTSPPDLTRVTDLMKANGDAGDGGSDDASTMTKPDAAMSSSSTGGCGCEVGGGDDGAKTALLLVVLLAVALRRRQ